MATAGDPEAQFDLARVYLEGVWVPRDVAAGPPAAFGRGGPGVGAGDHVLEVVGAVRRARMMMGPASPATCLIRMLPIGRYS